MFKRTKRDILRVPMGLFEEPGKDPVFLFQYLTSGERQRIIEKYTQTVHYPKPGDVNLKRTALIHIFQRDGFTTDFKTLCQEYIAASDDEYETFQKAIGGLILQHIAHSPQELDYIEKIKIDDVAVVCEMAERCVVGWENVIDDDTGEPIPYSKEQLRTWLADREGLYVWLAQRFRTVFSEFDALLETQKETDRKN